MGYYYHGTGPNLEGLDTMLQIIETGGIKSKKAQNGEYYTLFNGDDYISVAKWCYDELPASNAFLESAFFGWIFNVPCFIIDDSIEAIHAKKVERPYSFDHNKDRVTQFIDEWHVKDEIPLDKIAGIAIPFELMRESKEHLIVILKILHYAKLYGWQVYEANMDLIENVEHKDPIFAPHGYEKTCNKKIL